MIQKKWQLIDEKIYNPPLNLSIEEIIFRKIEKDNLTILRFWQNDKSVIIGSSQKINEVVNMEKCRNLGINIYRRFSGGGAVYQDLGNLNYSIFFPTNYEIKNIYESYDEFCKPIVLGLSYLGINLEIRENGNLYLNGLKISGSAQARRVNNILHHGTLMIKLDISVLSNVLPVPNDNGPIEQEKRVTTLSKEGYKYSLEIIKENIIKGFINFFKIDELEKVNISDEDFQLANKLFYEKYSNNKWNFRR